MANPALAHLGAGGRRRSNSMHVAFGKRSNALPFAYYTSKDLTEFPEDIRDSIHLRCAVFGVEWRGYGCGETGGGVEAH